MLGDNPRPPAATSLAGHPSYLRVRVGDWRVVYKIDRGRLVVLVLTIGHRGSVYHSLP
jgi:mRNA interferase RelE/StbE